MKLTGELIVRKAHLERHPCSKNIKGLLLQVPFPHLSLDLPPFTFQVNGSVYPTLVVGIYQHALVHLMWTP